VSSPSSIPTPKAARARKAALDRHRQPNDPALVEASRDLAAANLQQYIAQIVADAPPLSAAQRDHLAGLLRGGEAS
jgi:hypothetical protein